jgi:hypothetical protein
MQGAIKRDSLLGLLGFVVAMAALILVRPLGLFFINKFVDPYLVAWIGAALLPLVLELLRFVRSRFAPLKSLESVDVNQPKHRR